MMYADTAIGRVEASPGLAGTCPSCGQPCRPRCGQINIHHWAHHARGDCDPWSEPESEWHRGWKLAVPPERREVVIGPHRADVVTAAGGVVELQHSAISPEVIEAREQFYGEQMAWIFDVTDAFKAGRIVVESRDGEWDHIWWKHYRRSAGACRRTVLLDLGNGFVLYLNRPPGEDGQGWCRPVTRESVEGWMRDGSLWQVRRVPPPPPAKPKPPHGPWQFLPGQRLAELREAAQAHRDQLRGGH
jgi:hypothetical protein